MNRSAILFIDRLSERIIATKRCTKLRGNPLIMHVKEKVFDVADEVLIATKSESQLKYYKEVVDGKAIILIDE